MKKLRRFFKELWVERYEILKALTYIISGVWYAYIVSVVSTSDSGIMGKIFFFVWSLVLVFLFAIYKSNTHND